MKKLLITTMAAASLAFCAKAEFISGTSFESIAGNPQLSFWAVAGSDTLRVGYDDSNQQSGEGYYWSTTSEDGLFVVSNLQNFANSYTGNRPAYWADKENSKALFIDSDKPLVRNVNAWSGSTFSAYDLQENSVDRNLFFDSVVQFTATDTAPTVDYTAGDKLIAWLYYSEDATTDNPGIFGETVPLKRLVITAGYYDENSTLMAKNYLTDLPIEPDTWHRLTIKAINNTGSHIPGFQVWVDGVQVGGTLDYLNEAATAVTTFPSLAEANGGGVNTVTGVAFDGKGAVDDLVFTTTDPFAGASYAVTVTLTDDDDVIGGYYKAYSVNNGATFTVLDETVKGDGVVLTVPATTESIIFKMDVVDGYKIDGVSASTGEATDDGAYWIKTVTLADIIEDGAAEIALAIVADEGGEEPATTYGVAVDCDSKMATVSVDNATYAEGATVVFTVAPVKGYEVTAVTVAGATTAPTVTALDATNYTFKMPAEAVTITVEAQAKSYELTLTAANATVKGVETGMYAYNSKISFKVEVASDYTLKGVTMNDNALTAGDDGSYTFTMPAADVALVVTTEKTQEAAKPTVNGTAATDADDFKAAAKSGSTITLPENWKLENGVITDADGNTYATFESYYTATLGEDGTSFTVAFNDTVKPEVGDSTAGDAIAVTTDKVTLGITNAKAGLIYSVQAYFDAACTTKLGEASAVKTAEVTGGLTLEVTKPADVDAAFFKVQVTDKEVVTE